MFEKQKGLAEKLQAAKDSAAEERSKLERQIRQLKTENNELREQDDDKQEELDSLERKYRRQLDEYQTRSRALEQSNNEMREELQSNNQVMVQIHEKLAGKDGEVQDLETELVQWKAQAGDLETLKVIKKELSEQVHHIKTLESTNRRQLVELKSLRDTNKSLELVEEEKRTLEGRLKMLDELRDEYSAAQLRISVLQDERNAWESYFHSEGLKFDTPESLAKALVEERVERAALLEKTGRLEPKIQEKDKVILELEGEVRLFREELEKLKETASKDNKARQRMERQRAMALKEAEFLREQLKSHSAEESIYNQGGFDEQKSQRIQELEGLLESYKAEIEELRSAASAAAASNVGNEAAVSRKRSLDDAANDERLGELTRRNRQLQDGENSITDWKAMKVANILQILCNFNGRRLCSTRRLTHCITGSPRWKTHPPESYSSKTIRLPGNRPSKSPLSTPCGRRMQPFLPRSKETLKRQRWSQGLPLRMSELRSRTWKEWSPKRRSG